MMRSIKIVPYNPNWPDLYRQEARKIAAALAGEIILIHHIGSTAIPGIKAKPVIDCLIEVYQIERVDSYNDELITLGYHPRGENGIPGRRYFNKKIGNEHTHHLHIFKVGHPEIDRHLDFRDYLRAHPNKAQAYSQLKEKLAEKYRHDSVAYTAGKNEFVREIDQKAARWRKNSPPTRQV
jgi:GrpB-like predicted nucleotidyltransferase (UPF0157 family)